MRTSLTNSRASLTRAIPATLLAVVLAVPMWSAGAGLAAAQPSIDIVGHGRYVTDRSGVHIKKPKTASGEVTPVRQRRLVQKSTEIFGQLGRSFGVELDLHGFPPGPVTLIIRTIHPPLTNPQSGRTTTVSEYDWQVISRRKVYFGFTFDHRWELAEGIWTQQFWYGGKLLAEKKFKVVVPLN